MNKILLAVTALIISTTMNAQTWSLDKSHARLGFSITHMMISDVEGSFKSFDATVTSSKSDFTDAVIELTADMNSVNTESEKRDGHIKGPDFFDVAKFSSLTFKSSSLKKINGKNYKLAGNLTMHGVTKPVVLDVVFNGTAPQQGNTRKVAGFKVSGSLKRSDFGIGTGVPTAMLSDEVALVANVEFKQNENGTQ